MKSQSKMVILVSDKDKETFCITDIQIKLAK